MVKDLEMMQDPSTTIQQIRMGNEFLAQTTYSNHALIAAQLNQQAPDVLYNITSRSNAKQAYQSYQFDAETLEAGRLAVMKDKSKTATPQYSEPTQTVTPAFVTTVSANKQFADILANADKHLENTELTTYTGKIGNVEKDKGGPGIGGKS